MNTPSCMGYFCRDTFGVRASLFLLLITSGVYPVVTHHDDDDDDDDYDDDDDDGDDDDELMIMIITITNTTTTKIYALSVISLSGIIDAASWCKGRVESQVV